jgi:hypothetical protein
MLCEHSGLTPAMHSMHAQQRPHMPMKPRESALIPFVKTRHLEVGPAYAWQLSRTPRISPQTNTCFHVHFILTHAHQGMTSRSVTYCSRTSTLNFGVSGNGLPDKKLPLISMSILINPFMPWAMMSYTPPILEDRRPRRSTPIMERPLLATSVGLVPAHVPCRVTTQDSHEPCSPCMRNCDHTRP